MRVVVIASAVATMIAGFVAGTANAQPVTRPGITEISAPAEPLKDPVMCRVQQAPKSKTSMILCAHRSEWARRTEEDREMLERLELRNAH